VRAVQGADPGARRDREGAGGHRGHRQGQRRGRAGHRQPLRGPGAALAAVLQGRQARRHARRPGAEAHDRQEAAGARRLIPASADAVVVGSGAFGASAAYHLARRGARVALLERGLLASQTSPRAAGLTSQIRATPSLTKPPRRAVVKLAAFTDLTSQPLRFTQSGALKIARTDRDGEQLGREIARGRAAGIEIDWITIAEARRRLPILGERGIVAITWSPTDCNVEPSELPLGYCRAAEKLGAVLLPHTPAIGFEIGPGGVEGVRTPHGTIATR